MANLDVYLDVNIDLSKYRFNGVAFFEIVRFSLRKMIFFANIYLSKYAAWKNPALSKATVRITLGFSNVNYRVTL